MESESQKQEKLERKLTNQTLVYKIVIPQVVPFVLYSRSLLALGLDLVLELLNLVVKALLGLILNLLELGLVVRGRVGAKGGRGADEGGAVLWGGRVGASGRDKTTLTLGLRIGYGFGGERF